MTKSQLITLARRRFNSVNDSFFSDEELYSYIYELCSEAAVETDCIKAYATDTTVADQRDYDVPTRALKLLSVYVDDEPIDEISLKRAEDDWLLDADDSGTPTRFWQWVDSSGDRKISFDPKTATAAQTIKFYYLQYPDYSVSGLDAIPIPEQYHAYLTDGMLAYMYSKDQNVEMAAYYDGKWANNVQKVRTAEKINEQGNRYKTVRVVE